ncbi:COG0714 MoxR-like ATPases [Caulobacteraceae bacterium]
MTIDQECSFEREDTILHGPLLPPLGVYGFGAVETVILTALVTEDPLLLIGRSGTGKTFLLNSLSEALALEHRHYNASLISFDDLVGFPYPQPDGAAIRFLETPATVWSAQSVLIDELSRCKPEHQNRLFSLIHERRIQGLALPRLRFRWAAMNPPSCDQGGPDDYLGSEPLDPALADRFGLFVRAADWDALSDEERVAIANPAGEGRIADDGGRLARLTAAWREAFLVAIQSCPAEIITYVTLVIGHLNTAGLRISPRRSRLLARSLLAGSIIEARTTDGLFRTLLDCSLPQTTSAVAVNGPAVAAAHRAAWAAAFEPGEVWLHRFLAEPSLAAKVRILRKACPSPDAGSQAVAQLLAAEGEVRRLAFAFAAYPAAAMGALPIGSEGVNDLAKVAGPILSVDGEISWQGQAPGGGRPPQTGPYVAVVSQLRGARRERAQQFFRYCLVARVQVPDPGAIEAEIEAIVGVLRKAGAR